MRYYNAEDMSRSYHVTLRDLRRPRLTADERKKLRAELRRKRLTKFLVGEQRARVAPVAGAPPDAIPIDVERAPGAYYPAEHDDLRAVMARLPPGAIDGLAGVRLRVGREAQLDYARRRDGRPAPSERDPLLGRYGRALWPGVYVGVCLGQYDPDTSVIDLYAYAVDPAALRPADAAKAYLRLGALSTFVHEVAHHVSHSLASRRGRWFAGEAPDEIYAERYEHAWTRDVVAPYLERAYPDACRAFEAFVRAHACVGRPLAWFAGDPRKTRRGGRTRTTLSSEGRALEGLFAGTLAGREPLDLAVEFADELHFADLFEDALEAVEATLARYPGAPSALALRADVLEHLGRFDEAEGAARDTLARAPREARAWETIAALALRRGAWRTLAEAGEQLVALRDDLHDQALACRAAIELGVDAQHRVEALVAATKPSQYPTEADVLAALWALRRGDPAASFALANERLVGEPSTAFRSRTAPLKAICLEAAKALGVAEGLPTLDEADERVLHRQGFERP